MSCRLPNPTSNSSDRDSIQFRRRYIFFLHILSDEFVSEMLYFSVVYLGYCSVESFFSYIFNSDGRLAAVFLSFLLSTGVCHFFLYIAIMTGA